MAKAYPQSFVLEIETSTNKLLNFLNMAHVCTAGCLLLGIVRTTNNHKGDFAFDLSEGLDHGNQFTEGQLPTLLRCHMIVWTRKLRLVTGLEQLVALGHEAKGTRPSRDQVFVQQHIMQE